MKRFLPRSRCARMAPTLLALCVTACGGTNGPKPYPVKGVVRVNGEPAAGATVALYATTPFDRTIIPAGVAEADGSFTLTTYAPKDGAPAGEYEVAVTWPTFRSGWKVGEDRLRKAFSDPKTSGLKARVEAKADNELPPFDLKAEVAPPDPDRKGGKNKDH